MIFDKSITRRTMGYILSAFTHTFLPFLSICTQSLSLNLALHILVFGLIPHNSLDIISTDVGSLGDIGRGINVDLDGDSWEAVISDAAMAALRSESSSISGLEVNIDGLELLEAFVVGLSAVGAIGADEYKTGPNSEIV